MLLILILQLLTSYTYAITHIRLCSKKYHLYFNSEYDKKFITIASTQSATYKVYNILVDIYYKRAIMLYSTALYK